MHSSSFFLSLSDLAFDFFDTSSELLVLNRRTSKLTRLTVGSGEGVLLTLLLRLILGVGLLDDTAGLSDRRTPFLYPVSNSPCNAATRGPLPFRKFQTENFSSASKSFPRPKRRKTRVMARGSLYKIETWGPGSIGGLQTSQT